MKVIKYTIDGNNISREEHEVKTRGFSLDEELLKAFLGNEDHDGDKPKCECKKDTDCTCKETEFSEEDKKDYEAFIDAVAEQVSERLIARLRKA